MTILNILKRVKCKLLAEKSALNSLKMSDTHPAGLFTVFSVYRFFRREVPFYAKIFYNLIEGFVSVYFGVEESSISLLGFGLDSFVEVGSASIVLLKLRNVNPDLNLSKERQATLLIGISFLILAFSVFASSGNSLIKNEHPETTIPGILVSLVSLSFMFFLWRSKARLGFAMNSSTVMVDAKCSLACIKLSIILVLGSVIFWISPGLGWIDSVMALVLGIFIAKEGVELIQSSRKQDFKGGCGCH